MADVQQQSQQPIDFSDLGGVPVPVAASTSPSPNSAGQKSIDFSDLGAIPVGVSANATQNTETVQRRALTRPDLVAPPGVARPQAPMSNSALGTVYASLTHGPDGNIVNPKLAGARSIAENAERESQNPSPLTQVQTGVLDAGLQTVHTTARIANAVTGDNVPGLPTTFKEPEQITPHGGYENTGSIAEQLAEFAIGEGEAKAGATALAEHYGQVAKLAKVIEETPLLKKALNVARISALSAAQSGAHGQDVVQGAEYGAAGGTIGELAGAGAGLLKSKTPEALEAAAKTEFEAGEVSKAAKNAASQQSVQGQLSDTVKDAYTRQGASAPTKLIVSYGDLADDLRAKAKPVFQQLDSESDGAFQATKNKIDAAKKIIRNPSSMDALEHAQTSLTDGQAQLDKIFGASKLDPQNLQDARTLWRVSSTLDDLHGRLDKAFSVPQTARSAVKGGVTLDPKKFSTQLNNAVRSIPEKQLTEAIGADGVQNLYKINQQLATTLTDASRTAALNRVLQAAARNAPKDSPLSSLIITPVAGAVTGATIGATRAKLKNEDVTSGAAQGALYGGAAGVAADIPISAIHFLYAHPTEGVKLLTAAGKSAPLASQAVKQVATHDFNPAAGEVEPRQ